MPELQEAQGSDGLCAYWQYLCAGMPCGWVHSQWCCSPWPDQALWRDADV